MKRIISIIVDLARGKTIRLNIVQSDAPSVRADSIISIGIVYKLSRIEKFVNNIKQLSDGYEDKNFIEE